MLPFLRELELKFISYLNYIVNFVTGIIRDQIDKLTGKGRKPPEPGYVPVLGDFQDFFVRRFYHRITDCFARVVTSNAGAFMDIKMPKILDIPDQTLVFTGETKRVMNLGSYNYLGFGDPDEYCTPIVKEQLRRYGPSTCSTLVDFGMTTVHRDLEKTTAEFLGTEDAICYGMGWATNATTIAVLVGKGDLVISDALNHNSIITGVRSSGATVRIFRHNEMDHLEKTLRRAIIQGQPRTHRPWNRILVIVEGIYSMEGETVPLDKLVELRRKYHFAIWLDEAHSIGCMGDTGRGVCEHYHVDPKEIDILMGTFTKSFGAAGGYIAGSKKLIDYLRLHSFGNVYADAMPAPVAQQACSVLKVLMHNPEGKRRIKALHENAIWFREELKKRDYNVLGETGSPVVPVMMPPFAIFTSVSRECLERGLGLVVVCFPACDILQGRIRICLNAIHTREELQKAIDIMEEVCKDYPVKIH
ncbi:aminotransferase, classes I and II family protein [Histomonas meleagridis]|uniref:aminotransferase, classes I and II family protein n=1 Tax=Histomonas meleagridis TaxID=135588 RepID=UPI003559A39C|nr:aminotransferase, classes I and II family protein [Histomonas meleagridis]KAH0800083.1 aminotransferase, classes I and II family protein [Histomonas meleagridis]